jgi:hypothetical protein
MKRIVFLLTLSLTVVAIACGSSARKNQTVQTESVGSTPGAEAKVYFTADISPQGLVKIYKALGVPATGRVAVKISTGESAESNYLRPELIADLVHEVKGTLVECNTAYGGNRTKTEDHRRAIAERGFEEVAPVDIMDAEAEMQIPVTDTKHLKYDIVGKHLENYDFMVNLAHFKGHAMGGFGGSMKNIAIGCASGQVGKREVHLVVDNMPADFTEWPAKEALMESMADSAKATCDYFGKHIVFLNVMRRMSVDCDCAGVYAEEPTIADIGICASTDILAIDQACCDMVFTKPEGDQKDLVERITSRHGLHQLTAMREQKMGNPQYELIEVE